VAVDTLVFHCEDLLSFISQLVSPVSRPQSNRDREHAKVRGRVS
jgi:hypothetical protein